jgi:hypothetical protein
VRDSKRTPQPAQLEPQGIDGALKAHGRDPVELVEQDSTLIRTSVLIKDGTPKSNRIDSAAATIGLEWRNKRCNKRC